MAKDPVSGPMPRDQFKRLIDAPFGEAAKVIRKYDPQFGRKEGEKFEWKVTATSQMTGTAIVMAASEEEANDLADDLNHAAFDWDGYSEDLDIDSVEPNKD